MVDSFISKRVWSLPCWDLTETSKRDDGIDLLKDKQALRRLTETTEKAKMDLSSLTQTNISLPFITLSAMVLNTFKPLLQGQSLRSCVLTSSTGNAGSLLTSHAVKKICGYICLLFGCFILLECGLCKGFGNIVSIFEGNSARPILGRNGRMVEVICILALHHYHIHAEMHALQSLINNPTQLNDPFNPDREAGKIEGFVRAVDPLGDDLRLMDVNLALIKIKEEEHMAGIVIEHTAGLALHHYHIHVEMHALQSLINNPTQLNDPFNPDREAAKIEGFVRAVDPLGSAIILALHHYHILVEMHALQSLINNPTQLNDPFNPDREAGKIEGFVRAVDPLGSAITPKELLEGVQAME
ncbi:hypothetical protein Syun_017320 [Stephania yunnanensis]|uniref:Uncharacterized protein n=1 Tax=Stephania yunnanensis TaxID=152371 RepID=A0AAP0J8Z0_9MAGN